MSAFVNIDLLTVGVAIAAIGILGFTVFFNDRKSNTNQTFLLFAIVAILWNIANYASSQSLPSPIALWSMRSVVFFAVWYTFLLFQLFYVFPKKIVPLPKLYKFWLLPVALATAILTLTPFVFSHIVSFTDDGKIESISNGPGIFIFGVVVFSFIGGALLLLSRKIRTASPEEKIPYRLILIGISITFFLHLGFNFILPAFFNNPRFIPFGAVFTFPFVVFTAYAIIKHQLLNIKTVATEIFAFVLTVATFLEIIFSQSIGEITFRTSAFFLILAFSILLIRSVRKEVEQREELQKLTHKLEAANEELKRLDEAKSEFVSIASHQLRTPLTASKGYLSLALEGTYGKLPEKIRKPMAKVYESNERLIRLVNDLLSLSRIESGKMKLELEQTNIAEIIQSVISELQVKAAQKNLTLAFRKPTSALPTLQLDKEKIRNVVLNLIDNAIHYTQQGAIEVSLAQENKNIKIAVKDTGEGMTQEEIGKLFESFSRGEAGAKLSTEGAGLGLYIAKQFVQMHNGKIWAESEGKGKGSMFHVELPIHNVS